MKKLQDQHSVEGGSVCGADCATRVLLRVRPLARIKRTAGDRVTNLKLLNKNINIWYSKKICICILVGIFRNILVFMQIIVNLFSDVYG